ncbi:hypothetical protein ATO7_06280 [Oceanococcus atlanticus]|uniref:Uncharacterized protein n=2 Tax=Oceanococcus atlanticus TaxID=1317117 RepID=A0A1Y1SIG2_9GAMM|nr:hypothetical protein ATO7_06280 [Oceanococcus atlanticus]
MIELAGYKNSKLKIMNIVVRCALESLIFAESKLADNWESFCKKKGALCKASKSIQGIAKPEENAVTNALGEFIDEHLKGLPIEDPLRMVEFRYESPKKSKILAGSHQKRIDLKFEARYPNGPEFVIEAKPLFSKRDINSKLLGPSGLGRFTRTEEPYTNDHLAALLGYVVDKKLDYWNNSLNESLSTEDHCEQMETVILPIWKSDIPSTRHARPSGVQPIWMLHLLVTYPESAHPHDA